MNTPPMPGAPSRATLQSTTGRIAAVATALLLVLFLVLSVSRAAFVASTNNPGNSASTAANGAVTLTDNDSGDALFEASDLSPLDVLNVTDLALLNASAKCIHVQYNGDFTSNTIQLYTTPVLGETDLGALAQYLDVKVEMVEIADIPDAVLVPDENHTCAVFNVAAAAAVGGPTDVYSGSLSALGGDYANGRDTFPGEQSTYAFRMTVNVQNNPAAANKAAAWNFVWQAENDLP